MIFAPRPLPERLSAYAEATRRILSPHGTDLLFEAAAALTDLSARVETRKVPCPNCGCDYATARELRAWKDGDV